MNGYRDVEYYFKDEGLNFYLSEEKFYELRPVLDFAVDSPDDMNPQFGTDTFSFGQPLIFPGLKQSSVEPKAKF